MGLLTEDEVERCVSQAGQAISLYNKQVRILEEWKELDEADKAAHSTLLLSSRGPWRVGVLPEGPWRL